jgi:hypothetical protein
MMPDCQSATVEDADHNIIVTYAQRTVGVMSEFLDGLQMGTASGQG